MLLINLILWPRDYKCVCWLDLHWVLHVMVCFSLFWNTNVSQHVPLVPGESLVLDELSV